MSYYIRLLLFGIFLAAFFKNQHLWMYFIAGLLFGINDILTRKGG